jgi:DNA-nicking Smr family endonuclease
MAKRLPLRRGGADGGADDAEIFRAAVRDVIPLAQSDSRAPPGLPRNQGRARMRKAAASASDNLDETMPLIDALPNEEAAAAAHAVTGDGVLSFQRAGVRIQSMRRLRRGLYPVEDELDLHGFNQAEARRRLADFLARSRDGGCRCVRIVHGKGYRSGARGPVLKTAVNLWLRRHMDVMAFVSARAIDGGSGAVYVLLRA